METQELLVLRHFPIVGWLELVVSSRGVRSISFVSGSPEPRGSVGHPILEQLVHELDGYFRGAATSFSVPLDPASGTLFQRRVWEELSLIPYGQTRSYSDVARGIGKPAAVRAVGLANKNNPIPIVVPCHRVIKADGSLGGYSSGIAIKKALLELEGIRL